MSEDWQPIETAPRDGTWFLAYGSRVSDEDIAPKIGCARWCIRKAEYWEDDGPRRKVLVERDESHWDYDHGDIAAPTHWMPLPKAPA